MVDDKQQEIVDRVLAGDSMEPPNPISAPPRRTTKSRHTSGRRTAPRASEATSRTTPPRKQPTRKEEPDYTAGIAGIGQLLAAPLLVAGQVTKRDELIADAAAVTIHTPPIAQELNNLAKSDPRFAAALDKILAVGPYAALLAVTMPLAAQIATNHRRELLPMTQAFGAVEPSLLVAQFTTAEGEPSNNGAAPAVPTG